MDVARSQHAAYVAALEQAGCRIHSLPPAHDLPDSCFVEDQAVVLGGLAVQTRSGHPGRRAEAAVVGSALADLLTVHEMAAPATLDGGDVVVLAGHLLVGESARTNAEGRASLQRVFGPLGYQVRSVPVPSGELHLKGLCSPVGPDTILVARGTVDPSVWPDGVRVIEVPSVEDFAANVVRAGDSVLYAANHPEVAAALATTGLACVPVDTSEIRKGDGALTCLSIVFDA